MAEVRFCEECNNILYAKSDRKSKKLIYVCRSCEYISLKPNENNNIVARINYNYDRKEDIYIHPETKNDPALGRVRDWVCKQCGNNEAVFLQLAEKISYNPMALIYVCTNKHCHYWEKEAQQINDDNYFNNFLKVAYDTNLSLMININVGVLGHVDSGKTSLCKCLSQVLSTCALDKHKESKERGITIDLEKKKKKYDVNQKREIQTNLLNDQTTDQKESFLYCKREEKNDLHNIQYDKTNIEYNEEQNCYDYTNDKHHSNNIYFYDEEIIQICLVDCPGHHSLLKSIIMGSEITDIIILVIDINKGIQKQTIECLVLCKIINCDIIIVLNKIDLIPLHLREKKINLMKKKIQEAFYKFKSLQSLNYHIVSISANVKGKDNKDVEGDPPNLLSHDKKGVKILLSGDNKDLPILLSDDKKDPPILLNDDKKDPPNLLNDDKKDIDRSRYMYILLYRMNIPFNQLFCTCQLSFVYPDMGKGPYQFLG
ncbi:hypothetical protein PFFCH_04335 [Plasmodium falciparum FCH/4]|uniref:Tr-type G domain-containing protein n=1 Tax=Plasmodium falciparum FCH/4 TaxID=1036724 RepID=A0A024VIR0_PLAFA|nr:hypothetical protein PFFCH_04335 [Plasmodium falciparum FCH/4]